MNRDMIKRVVALLLLGSLLLGLIPMMALATEADATIRQTVYKEGIGIRAAMSGPIDPAELIVTGPEGEVAIQERTDDGSNGNEENRVKFFQRFYISRCYQKQNSKYNCLWLKYIRQRTCFGKQVKVKQN